MKDDTAFVQNILASRNAYLPAGDYYCKTLGLPSLTRFHGDGREVTRIYAHPDIGNAPMLQGALETDREQCIEAIGFYDEIREGRTAPCLTFTGSYQPHFERIGVYDAYLGIALANTIGAEVCGSVIDRSGTGIWNGTLGANRNRGTKISKTNFHDTRASPISVAGGSRDYRTEDTVIDGCTMYRVGENAIYGNAWNVDTTVRDCKIDTVRRDDVAGDNGTGVEFQGEGLKFIDNSVRNIDWSCLLLFQPRGAIIRGNTFSNPGQNTRHGEPGNDPSACIRFNSLGVNSEWQPKDGPYQQPKKIIVDGNICEDSEIGLHYGIVFQGEADCLLFEDVTLINNITYGSVWRTPSGMLVKQTSISGLSRSVWGDGCSASGNIGFSGPTKE